MIKIGVIGRSGLEKVENFVGDQGKMMCIVQCVELYCWFDKTAEIKRKM